MQDNPRGWGPPRPGRMQEEGGAALGTARLEGGRMTKAGPLGRCQWGGQEAFGLRASSSCRTSPSQPHSMGAVVLTRQVSRSLGMLDNVCKQVLLAFRVVGAREIAQQPLCIEQPSEQRASQPQCQQRQEKSPPSPPTRRQCLSFTVETGMPRGHPQGRCER